MELIEPAGLHLDEVTTAMLGDLTELARQVNEIRPLSSEVLDQVRGKLFGELVFSSNAIEGNTLTIRETRLILQTKTYIDVRRKREAQEAINLGDAATRVEQLLDEEGAWHDISEFLGVHEILMKNVNDPIAGVLRNRDVIITGARRQPPGSQEASELVDRIFSVLRSSEKVNGLVLASWLHWAIARVHPFEDGNGRMARLWQDLILLRNRLTVAIIRPLDRDLYLDALGRADEGDFNPLAQLICQRVMSTFQTYINEQEAADQLQGWAADLVGEASAREAEKRKLAYQRWHHAVEQLRDAFERCAALINRGANSSLEVQIQAFDIIDQSTWETILAGGGAKKTWFFKAWFRKDDTIVWYYFFFEGHRWTPADETIGEPGPWVAITISQQYPGEELATKLDYVDDSPISIREILVLGKSLACRRRDASLKMVYDLDRKPIEVAKEFFEEILLKKLI